MAKIGLNNFKFGVLTEGEGGVATYGAMQSLGKAVDANVSITSNSAVLYADDAIAESDNTFSAGTITLTVDDEDNTVFAVLLGHEIDSSTQEMIRNSNDTPPYVGVGRIINKLKGGVRYYKVEFLSKVKFAEPSQENTTHGETTEFGTQQIEGTIVTLADGTWSKTKTFTTHSAALEYLTACFGQTVTADTFTSSGSTTETLTYAPTSIFTVTVNGIPTTAYSVSGTTLTFDEAPTSGDKIYISYAYNA